MSVTISAVPFLLIYSIIPGATAVVGVGSVAVSAIDSIKSGISNSLIAGLKSGNENLHLESKDIEKSFFNKEFNTTIMDKDALIKTLKEHGATDIKQSDGNIECNCEYFHLKFTRNAENKPYTMTVTANENKGIDEFAKDIGSEYTLNAQEISYNKIKERLEKQNLEISDEEIYDDNTIVLTVDLGD